MRCSGLEPAAAGGLTRDGSGLEEVAAGRLRRRDAQMPVGRQGRDAAARGALQIALLDQVGLDHILDRVALLADRGA